MKTFPTALTLACLCLPITVAWADDIELVFTVTTAQGETTQAVTLHDVQEGTQPSVAVALADGRRMRLDTDISFQYDDDPALEPQLLWDLKIWASEPTKNGWEKAKLVSSPRVINRIEQPATIKQGQLDRDGATELTLQIDVQYRQSESPPPK
jgi:hypothetical protein